MPPPGGAELSDFSGIGQGIARVRNEKPHKSLKIRKYS